MTTDAAPLDTLRFRAHHDRTETARGHRSWLPHPGARSSRPDHAVRDGQAGKATAMAKGQQKSNREAKKPKKEKPKPAAGARSDLTATLEGGKARKK